MVGWLVTWPNCDAETDILLGARVCVRYGRLPSNLGRSALLFDFASMGREETTEYIREIRMRFCSSSWFQFVLYS